MGRKSKRQYTRATGGDAVKATVIDDKPLAATTSGRVAIAVEFAHIDSVYEPRRPQARLNARQARALRCAFDGMCFHGVKFNNRELRSPTEVIMVILDRIADEMGLDEKGC